MFELFLFYFPFDIVVKYTFFGSWKFIGTGMCFQRSFTENRVSLSWYVLSWSVATSFYLDTLCASDQCVNFICRNSTVNVAKCCLYFMRCGFSIKWRSNNFSFAIQILNDKTNYVSLIRKLSQTVKSISRAQTAVFWLVGLLPIAGRPVFAKSR